MFYYAEKYKFSCQTDTKYINFSVRESWGKKTAKMFNNEQKFAYEKIVKNTGVERVLKECSEILSK